MKQTAILIGYGSVGRVHAKVLQRWAKSLAIVDVSDAARQAAQADSPDALIAESLDALSAQQWPWDQTLAVIATWGPSHHGLFVDLVERGVKAICCEKPLAHSVRLGAEMVQTAAQRGVALAVNQSLRYMGRADAIARLAAEYDLGKPQLLAVHGGASGLVTNGVHFVDLASALFGSQPQSAVGTAHGEAINPRSPDLQFYGGTTVYSFGPDQEAILSMSNQSSVVVATDIYFRNGVLSIPDGESVQVRRRPRDAVERFPAVTRTGPASEVVYTGPIPDRVPNREQALMHMYQEAAAGEVTISPGDIVLAALSACIAGLTAGAIGQRVTLPIDPESEIGRREWLIS